MSLTLALSTCPINQLGSATGKYLKFDEKANQWSVVKLNLLEKFLRWIGIAYGSTNLKYIASKINLDATASIELKKKVHNLWQKTYPMLPNPIPRIPLLANPLHVAAPGAMRAQPYDGPDLLSQLLPDLIPYIASNLNIYTNTRLAQTCKALCKGIGLAKINVKSVVFGTNDKLEDYDKSWIPKYGKVDDDQLAIVLQRHPRITHLSLCLDNLTELGMQTLAHTPQLRSIVHLTLVETPSVDNPKAQKGLRAYKQLMQRINFSKLISFTLIQPTWSPEMFRDILKKKLQVAAELKSLRLHFNVHSPLNHSSEEEVTLLIQSLPSSLEEMGPLIIGNLDPEFAVSHFSITDSMIDLFMSKFDNPMIIRKCILNIRQVTDQKLKQLLEFLPLTQISELIFAGAEGMTRENLAYLAANLKQNIHLKKLRLIDLNSNVNLSDLLGLVNSLNSRYLEFLQIKSNRRVEAENPPELEAMLRQKLLVFRNLRELHIGSFDLINMKQELINE